MSEPVPDFVACPRCHGPIKDADDVLHCGSCGTVGRRVLGYLDFTGSTGSIALANGGEFDLDSDANLARRLIETCETSGEMFRLSSEVRADVSSADPRRSATLTRAATRYQRVEDEAGDRHGEAILDKVTAYVEDQQLPWPGRLIALEAGGGFGKYLKGFRDRFNHVVFVDCSLTNLVIAAKYAADLHLDDITFVRADVTLLPFVSDTFDFVHQNGVIEHVVDPDEMVRESLRVTRRDGIYACLSPNRYPVTKEPHFELRLFGIYPPSLRRHLIQRSRGVADEAGTDLRSLRDLRRVLARTGIDASPFFLPPSLPSIARRTPARQLLQRVLDRPALSATVRAVVNGPLLPIAPYHLVVTTGASTPSST